MKSAAKILLSAAMLVGTVGLSACTPRVIPKFSLPVVGMTNATMEDPCGDAERCVIGYFAPWCPICHRNVAFFREVRNQLEFVKGVRVGIIVGNDSDYNMEEFAYQIGGKVFIDRGEAFGKIEDFDSVPHWWVLDKNHTVLEEFSWSGSHAQDLKGAARRFIEGDLGLSDYVNAK